MGLVSGEGVDDLFRIRLHMRVPVMPAAASSGPLSLNMALTPCWLPRGPGAGGIRADLSPDLMAPERPLTRYFDPVGPDFEVQEAVFTATRRKPKVGGAHLALVDLDPEPFCLAP